MSRQGLLSDYMPDGSGVGKGVSQVGLLGSPDNISCERKNFDEAVLLGVNGLTHDYIIDWDKDENRLQVMQKNDVTIPGRGAITDIERCGTFHGSFLAGNDLRAVLYSCHKPTCPRCFREYAARQGKHSSAFIWGIKKYSGDTIYHSVFSPVEGVYTIEKLVEVIKVLMEKFHSGERGSLGYAYVVHPYRLRCLSGHSSPHERGYSGGNLPPFCSQCGLPWAWFYSPHIHVVSNFYVDCTSPIKAQAWNQAQADYHVKYANISQDDHYRDIKNQVLVPRPGYIPSVEILESIIKYELGHSMVKIGKRSQAIVYVGSWCRLNYKAEWSRDYEVAVNSSDVPFRRVHSVGSIDGAIMRISVYYCENGEPSWWNDWDDRPVYKYDVVYTCKVTPRRVWCDLHKRYERIDPLRRANSEVLLDNKELGDFV